MIEAAQIPKILIAGVGNELRQDDAFGLLLTRELLKNERKHPNLMIQEFGIGGIHLVQELHNQYDILIILDAVSWGGKAGDIYWRSATTEDINELPQAEKRNFFSRYALYKSRSRLDACQSHKCAACRGLYFGLRSTHNRRI